MRVITMKLIKEHKVLAEYAELDGDGNPVSKPAVSPIYLRKGVAFELLPSALEITLRPLG